MLTVDLLVTAALLLPVVAGVGSFVWRSGPALRAIVVGLAVVLIAVSLLLLQVGPFTYTPSPLGPLHWEQILVVGDAALIIAFFYYGWRARHALILGLTFVQALAVIYLETLLAQGHGEGEPVFYVDHLSLVMALVIGIVGSAIAVYALRYMEEHEHHLHLAVSRQPRFFLVFLTFLGAMNGLVFANSLPWLFFFWEVTTLCSFLLIGHDGTELAQRNAQRALWMNLVGGIAFALGMIVLQTQAHTLALQRIIAQQQQGALVLVALALLVLAGLTKAAQMPFQSWLLGAMVAPTPVSALLHSSTMVKAGVYLVVRAAPAFEGTALSQAVAIAGAFTFVTTAALAVGQSNAKRLLAYSTISNLGLIIACAGLNTSLAIGAAILLILFHAVSKGLLFLTVGVIEHNIGSRDIEDMEGLLLRMPLTTVVTLIGILSMLLPPFGVLIAKWAAIEAAAQVPLALLLFAAGSAFTVVFWSKWMGRLLTAPPTEESPRFESLSPLYSWPLLGLGAGAVLLTALIGWVTSVLVGPAVSDRYPVGGLAGNGWELASPVGAFPVWPLLIVLVAVLVFAVYRAGGRQQVQAAYLCGEQLPEVSSAGFRSLRDEQQTLSVGSHYYQNWLGETGITRWANPVAIALLVVLLGVAYLW